MTGIAAVHSPAPFGLFRSNYERIQSGEFGQDVKERTEEDIKAGRTVIVEM